MLRICKKCNVLKDHYGRGFCRACYRKETNEAKKYWIKTKNNKDLYLGAKNRQKKYFEKLKNDKNRYLEYKIKHNKYQRELYKRSPEKREYLKQWKKKQPIEKRRAWKRRDAATEMLGHWEKANRIMDKYGYKCIDCGMTNEEHLARYKSRLAIHHLDNRGRAVARDLKNNDDNNLVPLCKSCHYKRHK